jgi:hypothetical protein
MVKIGANVQNNSNKFLLDESFGDIMRKDLIDRTPIILKYLWEMKVFKGMLHFVIIYHLFLFFCEPQERKEKLFCSIDLQTCLDGIQHIPIEFLQIWTCI